MVKAWVLSLLVWTASAGALKLECASLTYARLIEDGCIDSPTWLSNRQQQLNNLYISMLKCQFNRTEREKRLEELRKTVTGRLALPVRPLVPNQLPFPRTPSVVAPFTGPTTLPEFPGPIPLPGTVGSFDPPSDTGRPFPSGVTPPDAIVGLRRPEEPLKWYAVVNALNSEVAGTSNPNRVMGVPVGRDTLSVRELALFYMTLGAANAARAVYSVHLTRSAATRQLMLSSPSLYLVDSPLPGVVLVLDGDVNTPDEAALIASQLLWGVVPDYAMINVTKGLNDKLPLTLFRSYLGDLTVALNPLMGLPHEYLPIGVFEMNSGGAKVVPAPARASPSGGSIFSQNKTLPQVPNAKDLAVAFGKQRYRVLLLPSGLAYKRSPCAKTLTDSPFPLPELPIWTFQGNSAMLDLINEIAYGVTPW